MSPSTQMNVWQERYDQDETPWEKDGPAPPLRAFLLSNRVHGKVLVPGCGIGHDVRLLAAQGASVLGLDLAPSAVERANHFPKVAQERFELGDFLNLPTPLEGQFDWVYENTCFCAIHPTEREAYAIHAARALKPGGHLFGVFYLDTGNPPGEGPPFCSTSEEIDRQFSAWFEPIQQWTPMVGFQGRVPKEEFRVFRKRPDSFKEN